MTPEDYKTMLIGLGIRDPGRGKALRRGAIGPPQVATVYLNWGHDKQVYFTTYQAQREAFEGRLWTEQAAKQAKDRRPGLITLVPVEGSERKALESLLDRWGRADVSKAAAARNGIPDGITESDIDEAADDLEAGRVDNRFRESTKWDALLDDGRRFPPKQLVGVAARRIVGHVLSPKDFSGGEESRCHAILESLDFDVVPKGDFRSTRAKSEERIEAAIRKRTDIGPTEKRRFIAARRGQGLFRLNVVAVETLGCRLTGVRNPAHLRASHIKPWSVSTDSERLDGFNGLLLAPHVDHLFDEGYLTFSDSGEVLLSGDLDPAVLKAWALRMPRNVGPFRSEQRIYLKWHRSNCFRGASIAPRKRS